MTPGPRRVKNTSPVPHVCIGCFWEDKVKAKDALNKQLRKELVKFTSATRAGRKPEQVSHEREEERDVPDLLDEMSGLGKINLDG